MESVKQQFKHILQTKFWKRPRNHPFVSGAFLSIFLFFMACFGLVVVNAQTIGPDDIKIVDVFEDGDLRYVPTRARTVEEFLAKQKIELDEFDVVEPSLKHEISNDNFEVKIFRGKPVAISDRGETKRLTSAYQEPRLIAEQAGYSLAKADLVEWADEPSLNVTREILISRAYTYQINLYGNIIEHKSRLLNVEDVLTEAGVVVQEGDTVAPGLGAVLNPDESITISRFGTQIITVEEEIAFEVASTNDSSLALGQVNVTKAGVKGRKTVVYEIILENDKEVSRKVIQEVVVVEPQTQEQQKGTKPPVVSNNVSGDKQFLMAAAGIAESDWGYVDYIVSRESGWNSAARNRSSGAYGLCQALPASKMASAGADYLTNPVTQLRWCAGYAGTCTSYRQYCGWSGAYAFWISNSWW